MNQIGLNLTVITAMMLINERQGNRFAVKHGWHKHTQCVGIYEGRLCLFELPNGLQSTLDEIKVNEDYCPLEGDIIHSLWDVWEAN